MKLESSTEIHTSGAHIEEMEAELSEAKSRDAADMIRMGKAQQTKRTFGLIPTLGFTTIMLCSWECAYAFFLTGFINGGGINLIYGYIFCWLGSLATCASISEMASIWPTSGGQYHWVALLSPPKYAKFLSFISAWVSALGWQAGAAAGTFMGGTMIQGLLVLNDPSYSGQRWQGTLLLYAVLGISMLVNTLLIRLMPFLEGIILFLHILDFFVILIPLVHLAPMSSADFVFATFVNASAYPDGLAWFVGLTASSVLFVGYDGAVHMAEEVKDAAVNVPRGMFFTIFVNGALGMATFTALLFAIGDVDSVLSTATGWPYMQIFYNATNSTAGTTAMASIVIALIIFADFSYVASASRQLWAFARDRGVPGWRLIARVDKRLHIPVVALVVTAVINAALGLINIGSTTAFNALISLTSAGLFSSYLITIGLLIRRRLVRDQPLPLGPWNMGRYGLAVNLVAFAYTLIVFVFSFFPPELPVTAVNMNWSCAVFGAVVIFGLVYYAAIGHRQYNGPVIDRQFIASIPT